MFQTRDLLSYSKVKVKVKVKLKLNFTLEQATKAQRGIVSDGLSPIDL